MCQLKFNEISHRNKVKTTFFISIDETLEHNIVLNEFFFTTHSIANALVIKRRKEKKITKQQQIELKYEKRYLF